MESVTQEVDMVMCLGARGILVPTMNDTHLGRWLKSHREEKKLTQMELAYAAGTTPATISRIEKGNQGATEKRVVEIAKAMGADPREALEALQADTVGLEPEIERIPNEDELQRALMGYHGTDPALNIAAASYREAYKHQLTAEDIAGAIRRAGPPLTGEEPEEYLVRGSKKKIQVVDGK